MSERHRLDYTGEPWAWKVYYNDWAETNRTERLYPHSYDVVGLVERAPHITDRYTVVSWEGET